MSTNGKTTTDTRLEMAADAIRGAMVSIRVALQLLGEVKAMQAEAPEPEPDDDLPARFGGGLSGTVKVTKRGAGKRPTPADAGADNPQNGG